MIVKVYSYTQFGGGDIMVEVSTPAAGCTKGFWISATDPGFKVTHVLVLSAYHTQRAFGSAVKIRNFGLVQTMSTAE
ncbi:hypothetical protein [Steroidobacter sp.]|uniref:hypothetical protein n=1 Tax=Steroidobacter sp. TaxID=1978227 RepID=UPI001A5311FB|nr:hypothetical protein [Steroidobacter sp.]MBL8271999.1 hypothetical protein [Steroidobacter sp.]